MQFFRIESLRTENFQKKIMIISKNSIFLLMIIGSCWNILQMIDAHPSLQSEQQQQSQFYPYPFQQQQQQQLPQQQQPNSQLYQAGYPMINHQQSTTTTQIRGIIDPNSPKPRYIGSCRERNLCCSGRDSSCSIPIVQNYQQQQQQQSPLLVRTQSISLIGNLLGQALNDNTKECYCDSACITLGDCCPDYKDTCGGK